LRYRKISLKRPERRVAKVLGDELDHDSFNTNGYLPPPPRS
jgi:hypothetical protein